MITNYTTEPDLMGIWRNRIKYIEKNLRGLMRDGMKSGEKSGLEKEDLGSGVVGGL